jgi:hypothetical protein
MINLRAVAAILTVFGIGAAGVAWATWPRGVTVVVRNKDSDALHGVTLHVTGRDYSIGDMPPGSTRSVVVEPTGASRIEISQQLAGGRGRVPVDCYFEGGYSGEIRIELSRASADVVHNRISVGLW